MEPMHFDGVTATRDPDGSISIEFLASLAGNGKTIPVLMLRCNAVVAGELIAALRPLV